MRSVVAMKTSAGMPGVSSTPGAAAPDRRGRPLPSPGSRSPRYVSSVEGIGRDALDLAGDPQQLPLRQRGEHDVGGLAGRDLVDVGRADPRLDDQLVGQRHQVEHRLARPDHAARGREAQVEDRAGDRGRDLGPAQRVVGRGQLLFGLAALHLDLGELLVDLLDPLDADVHDLQAGLADRLLGLGDLRLELALLAEQSGILAMQSQQARLALEPLAKELVDVRRLLLDQLALAPVADELALQAGDLPFELIDPLRRIASRLAWRRAASGRSSSVPPGRRRTWRKIRRATDTVLTWRRRL